MQRTERSEAVEAWALLRELAHRPETISSMQAVAAEAGVPAGLGKALVALSSRPPLTMRELAGALHCDASYVTSIVDGLEEHGMATRQPHPTDRRVKVVEPTPEGRTLGGRLVEVRDRPPAAFGALDDGELRTLVGLLRRLAERT